MPPASITAIVAGAGPASFALVSFRIVVAPFDADGRSIGATLAYAATATIAVGAASALAARRA